MAYRDLLVTVDGTEQAELTLKVALELSRGFNAHLTAVYPIALLSDLPYAGMAFDSVPLLGYTESLHKLARDTRIRFTKLADSQLVRLDWQEREGMPSAIVSEAGRLVDLVIFSQGDQNRLQSVIKGLSDDVLLHLGRPALIVPYIGVSNSTFRRVLVAWDGSRSAARAVNDAIPFLQQADTVEVFTIQESGKSATYSSNNNENICTHLLRHGIGTISTSVPPGSINPGATILNHASDSGADLLVIGAYGHSRLRETVFGGVTKLLLKSMTLPLFMSH